MSEFSESFHLAADDDASAEALLARAGTGGWVFAPSDGWVTLVPDGDFGQSPVEALASANDGLLVHYVNAEDHGWELAVWAGQLAVGTYAAEWTDDIEVSGDLDADRLADVVEQSRPGSPLDRVALRRLLTRDVDALEAMLLDLQNPAPQVAALLGWAEYDWLSGSYLAADGDRGGRRVG